MSRVPLAAMLIAGLMTYGGWIRQPAFIGTASTAKGVSAEERRALVALFDATDGNHWKNHDGWLGPVGSECTWHGIWCESRVPEPTMAVLGLELSENNLDGQIPEALGDLIHLQSLSLVGNHLSGRLPDPLIQQWLAGSLEVAAEAPLLTDVSEIDYEYIASALLCGRRRAVLRSDGGAALYTTRCHNASPKDRRTFCEVKTGRVYGEPFAMLAWLLEKNGFFAMQSHYERSISDSAFVSTRATRGGKSYDVVVYAGGGPSELWAIQMAIEGFSNSAIEWDATKILPACPLWEKSQPPASH